VADFVFENPPLVEVICEVHWQIQDISIIPGGGVDPQFAVFSEQFAQAAGKNGFRLREDLAPAEVPIEFLARKPTQRYRSGPNTWPLYQIGPGIFTANIVPPYQGWNSFRKALHAGFDMAYASYPIADKLFQIRHVVLRYLNGFTARHGLESLSAFLRTGFNIRADAPDSFKKQFVEGARDITYLLETRFGTASPLGGLCAIKIAPGKVKNDNAVILELRISTKREVPNSIEQTKKWFDTAHDAASAIFLATITDNLRKTFGAERKIESEA